MASGSAAAGLAGEVSAQQLARLFDAVHPDTGEALGASTGNCTRFFRELPVVLPAVEAAHRRALLRGLHHHGDGHRDVDGDTGRDALAAASGLR